MLSPEAIDYAWAELVRRAGWMDAPPPLAYTEAGQLPTGVRLRILPSARSLDDPGDAGTWGTCMPVPFVEGQKPLMSVEGDVHTIPVDLIKATLFMLCRVEEYALGPRDQHDRFPVASSWLFRMQALDKPVVDLWSRALGSVLQEAYPNWVPTVHRPTVEISHDIDHVRAFKTPLESLRRAAGDLVKRRSVAKAMGTLGAIARPELDLYMRAVRTLAEVNEANHFTGTFYFQTSDPSPRDDGYDVEEVRNVVDELRDRGHRIGFHPGYEAARDPERFAMEWARFEGLTGQSPAETRIRYHFLRVELPGSWRFLEGFGFRYEASLGFAGGAGFRAGTCFPYRPFDVEKNRVVELMLEPLVCMDASLQSYACLEPEAGLTAALTLAATCKQAGGTFSLLWHNTGLCRHWAHWEPCYRSLVQALR